MKTMCPPGYHHNGFVATHTKTYAHLAYVRFEHSVCRGSLMTTYIYIYIYIHIFFCLFVFFFVGGGDVYGCVCCMYVLVVL